MDFQPDANLRAFREEVRDFLRRCLPSDLAGQSDGARSPRADLVRWQRILHDQGWGAPHWPQAHGGPGWSVPQRLVFDEECMAVGVPTQDGFAHKLVGPVLNHFATPEQKAEHVSRMFTAERLWCQGFSEPGSGSDLASLKTQAVRDGDHYVVNGQKTWTSYGHDADWIFLLVRTDATVKKQAGITFLLVDMRTPGITVRPIHSIDGRHHLNETFFDNVRVPVANRVGEEGQGWKITKFLLNNEHASAAGLPTLVRLRESLRMLATSDHVAFAPLREQPAFLLRLARYDAEIQAIAMMVQRVAAVHGEHDARAQAMGSMLKVRGTELQQRMSEFVQESLGPYGAVDCMHAGDAANAAAALMPDGTHHLSADMFFRRAATIYGGTSEIQRGIVARLMFGL